MIFSRIAEVGIPVLHSMRSMSTAAWRTLMVGIPDFEFFSAVHFSANPNHS